MKEEKIGLTVEDNTLTLRGEKKFDPDVNLYGDCAVLEGSAN